MVVRHAAERLTHVDTVDLLATALTLAFGDVSYALRTEFPEIYDQVDAILSDPDRERWGQKSHFHDLDRYAQYIRECAWCGDPFLPIPVRRPRQVCSPECGFELRRWTATRRAGKETRLGRG